LDLLKICTYKQDFAAFKVDPNMEKDLDCCMIGRQQADMNSCLPGKVESNFKVMKLIPSKKEWARS